MPKELIELVEIYLRNVDPSDVMYHYRKVINGDNTIDAVLTVHINGEEEMMIRVPIAR